ncbi:MAG: glucose-1-phosphate cytidylyltransferase [bacterium]|nr:glucose-1-phosphate cytidylyltransferase [bacterium]
MKVVILCGGKGTRMKEETEFRPKPLVNIGGYPIIWHIMKIYAHYGFKDFVLCLGYKGNMIKEYFLNYEAMNNDFTVCLGAKNKIKFHSKHEEHNWNVTLVDTGEEAMTGARVKKVEKYIDTDLFMVTYGDGVADIDIRKLVNFHNSHGKIGTITGVHPSSRFGELIIKENKVSKFYEKPQVSQGLINGGFFVFKKEIFKYIKEDESCLLEKEPLETLAKESNLMAYLHLGFWQCVDTYRELEVLNDLWKTPHPPWKVW